jgi:putative transposase
VTLTFSRWYVADRLNMPNIEEKMQDRDVFVSYLTVHRWSNKVLPVLAATCRRL